MKPRMSKNSSSSSLKQEFLKKWIKGVQTCSNLNKEMTILDRKNAIKLSADVAIASTRNESTRWSQSVMNDAVSTNRTLVEQIVGRKLVSDRKNKPAAASVTSSTNNCSKRILRRSHRHKATRGVVRKSSSFSIAKKLVKKRTRVLKRLVPGGERISDEYSLIRETLDYILSLRVQVDVMRHFAAAAAKRFEPSKF
ncbi:hypothetical protein ABFS82_10G130700 [Erythranthe guttata]